MDYVSQVAEWKSRGIYPYFPVIEEPCGRTVRIQGEGEVIMLASCDYLGFSNDARIKRAAIDGIERFGTNICGSLAFSGMTVLHMELESALEEFMGTESAIIFPTSYLANLGCLSTITGPEDLLLFDSQNHVSLFHGARLSRGTLRTYRHNDIGMLEGLLKRGLSFSNRFIVTDGLFSADGDYANLVEIANLADRYDASIIVDSAHDIGTLGDAGRGIVDACGLLDRVDLIIGTMSKAFGSTGGFIAGKASLITHIRHAAGPFHSSRAVSPGVAAASIKAIELMKSEGAARRIQLTANSLRLNDGLRQRGYDTMHSCSPVIPVLFGDTNRTLEATSWLRKHGVLVCGMIPPSTPEKGARLRLNVTSFLNEIDISSVLELFGDMREYIK